MIQDIEPKHLYNEWKKNAVPKKSSAVVQFRGQDLLCRIDDNGLKFPSRAQFTEPDEAFTYLFELDGGSITCFLTKMSARSTATPTATSAFSARKSPRSSPMRRSARGTCARGTATRATAAAAEKSSSTTGMSA